MRKKLDPYYISEEFFNIFLEKKANISIREYLDNSYCDEVVEVNLNLDTYKIIYHVEGKYTSPVVDGKYSNLFALANDNVVHPDDRLIHDDLMNPRHVLERLQKSKTPNFRFAHFRYKVHDGTYRWVEQVVLAGKENGLDDGIFRFYVFDIHNVKIRQQGKIISEAALLKNEHDELTGLYKEKIFHQKAAQIIKKHTKEDWAVVSIDIEHFKLFDDWFGRDNGNVLLRNIGQTIEKSLRKFKGIGCYVGQDDFLLLMKLDENNISELFNLVRTEVTKFDLSTGFMPAVGVCALKDAKDYIDAIDKASIASDRAKKDIKNRIHYYSPSIHVESENEYHMLLDTMDALKKGQIEFYLQPQVRLSTSKIVGVEALARWKKDGEFISPVLFVPILEKYGFITDLDKYIWEEVFKWIKQLLMRGIRPVPVSINVSRVDIFTIDIADYLLELADKYKVPHNLIKVEITESAYAETSDVVAEIVNRLRNEGFMVLMDDFGSGYSSLNMLSSLKVDAIKLDALFLKVDANDQAGIRILESVINMAKQIGLPIIVEGVENGRQKDFLDSLGVRYIQGFYYYKPMPVEEFEQLMMNEDNIDYRGFIVKANDQFKTREFLDENVYSDSMLNNIIGPVAFYSYDGKTIDIVRYNNQFYNSVGSSEFSERLENIERFTHPDDIKLFHDLLDGAKDNKVNGSKGVIRFLMETGEIVVFLLRIYYIGEKEGRSLFYGSASNITQYAREHDYLTIISEYSAKTMLFVHNNKGTWEFRAIINGLEDELGYKIDELEQEMDLLAKGKKNEVPGYEWVNEVVKAFETSKKLEIKIMTNTKKGKQIPLLVEVIPVKSKTQTFEKIVVLTKIIK